MNEITSRARGRPDKYLPRHCQQVIELMSEGLSMTAVAGELHVSRSTLSEWEKRHPEFSDAVKRGRARAVLYWERRLAAVANGRSGAGATTAVIFALKNRARDEWNDRHEISGPNGKPIPVEAKADALSNPDEALNLMAQVYARLNASAKSAHEHVLANGAPRADEGSQKDRHGRQLTAD